MSHNDLQKNICSGVSRRNKFCVSRQRTFISAQQAQAAKPALVVFGDDIGQANISGYTRGLVGYSTPNIDRISHEGLMFTDYYAVNSCTAGSSVCDQSVKNTR